MIKKILVLILLGCLACTAAPRSALTYLRRDEFYDIWARHQTNYLTTISQLTNAVTKVVFSGSTNELWVAIGDGKVQYAGLSNTVYNNYTSLSNLIETNNYFTIDYSEDVLKLTEVGRFYARDIMCSNLLVLSTNDFIFAVDAIFSNSVKILREETNWYSGVNYNMLTNYASSIDVDMDNYYIISEVDNSISSTVLNVAHTLGEYIDDRDSITLQTAILWSESNTWESIDSLSNQFSLDLDGISNYFDTSLNNISNYFDANLNNISNQFSLGLDGISNYFDTSLNNISNLVLSTTNDNWEAINASNDLTYITGTNYADNQILDVSTNIINTMGEYTDDKSSVMLQAAMLFSISNTANDVYHSMGRRDYYVSDNGKVTNYTEMALYGFIVSISNNITIYK